MKREELIRSWIEIIHLMRDENVFVFESIPKMTRRRSSVLEIMNRRNFHGMYRLLYGNCFALYNEKINIGKYWSNYDYLFDSIWWFVFLNFEKKKKSVLIVELER